MPKKSEAAGLDEVDRNTNLFWVLGGSEPEFMLFCTGEGCVTDDCERSQVEVATRAL